MRNKQKGYTLTELLVVIFGLSAIGVVLFVVGSIIYAIGRFLFGWW